MARLSDLEHRLHAMFSSRANRLPAGPRFMLAVAAAALALLIPIAAFDAPLLALSDGISGVVKDPSGAVVPRARVSILFADNSRKEVLWTNPAGGNWSIRSPSLIPTTPPTPNKWRAPIPPCC